MLLACLQCQRIAWLAGAIFGEADDAAWQLPHELPARADVAEVRAARRQGNAEGLAIAADDVGAAFVPVAGRGEQGQGSGVRHGNHQGPGSVGGGDDLIHRLEQAHAIGLLDDDGRRRFGQQLLENCEVNGAVPIEACRL